MKLTIDQLKEILSQKPVRADESDIREVFSLLGFKLKEYNRAGLSHFQRYEVHYRRNYLVKVEVDVSRCLSLSNEFIDFGEGCKGVSFGGIDTVKELIQTVIVMVTKIDRSYTGQVSFVEDESEYTKEEFASLVDALNDEIFNKENQNQFSTE
jgi:hypothetical protein